jgi:uncharacterized protein YqeY
LLGADAVYLHAGGQEDFPLELAVVDFHGQHLHGAAFGIGGFGQIAPTANQEAVGFQAEIDAVLIDPGQINADAQTMFATVGVDGGLPVGAAKAGKMGFGQLVGHVTEAALEPLQAQGAEILRHRNNKAKPPVQRARRQGERLAFHLRPAIRKPNVYPMSIPEQIDSDLKDAMRAKQADKLSVLRMLKAAIKNAAIEKGGMSAQLDDTEATSVIRKQVKQRQDAVESFEKGGRAELADKERAEIEMLQAYLPKALSAEELAALVDEAIREVGATGKAQMGAVMKALQPKVAGRADGKTLSQEVQKRLA